MNENQKLRAEKALECVNAVGSSVRVGKHWLDEYYPPGANTSLEEFQHFYELRKHLELAEMVSQNLANLLIKELPPTTVEGPFLEVEDAAQ